LLSASRRGPRQDVVLGEGSLDDSASAFPVAAALLGSSLKHGAVEASGDFGAHRKPLSGNGSGHRRRGVSGYDVDSDPGFDPPHGGVLGGRNSDRSSDHDDENPAAESDGTEDAEHRGVNNDLDSDGDHGEQRLARGRHESSGSQDRDATTTRNSVEGAANASGAASFAAVGAAAASHTLASVDSRALAGDRPFTAPTTMAAGAGASASRMRHPAVTVGNPEQRGGCGELLRARFRTGLIESAGGPSPAHECGLCTFDFLDQNAISFFVTLKRIADLRACWHTPTLDARLLSTGRMYDMVGVCVFCAQFFQVDLDAEYSAMQAGAPLPKIGAPACVGGTAEASSLPLSLSSNGGLPGLRATLKAQSAMDDRTSRGRRASLVMRAASLTIEKRGVPLPSMLISSSGTDECIAHTMNSHASTPGVPPVVCGASSVAPEVGVLPTSTVSAQRAEQPHGLDLHEPPLPAVSTAVQIFNASYIAPPVAGVESGGLRMSESIGALDASTSVATVHPLTTGILSAGTLRVSPADASTEAAPRDFGAGVIEAAVRRARVLGVPLSRTVLAAVQADETGKLVREVTSGPGSASALLKTPLADMVPDDVRMTAMDTARSKLARGKSRVASVSGNFDDMECGNDSSSDHFQLAEHSAHLTAAPVLSDHVKRNSMISVELRKVWARDGKINQDDARRLLTKAERAAEARALHADPRAEAAHHADEVGGHPLLSDGALSQQTPASQGSPAAALRRISMLDFGRRGSGAAAAAEHVAAAAACSAAAAAAAAATAVEREKEVTAAAAAAGLPSRTAGPPRIVLMPSRSALQVCDPRY
jgi:hypothetical protein